MKNIIIYAIGLTYPTYKRIVCAIMLLKLIAFVSCFSIVLSVVQAPSVLADSKSINVTVKNSPIIENVGGSFEISYDHAYPVYDWILSLSDKNGDLEFRKYGFGQNIVIPDNIFWNGSSLEQLSPPAWSMAPAGTYHLDLIVTYLADDNISATHIQQDVLIQPAVKIHPVLFIHGVTSYPEMWQDASHNNDYYGFIEAAGYPQEFLASYHYSGVGVGKDGYNNQGDIAEMAMGMDAAVQKLSDTSKAFGGDGTVDIVCHSMGGLIARQYLLTHPTNHHIGKIVSMGTPYQGSWLMSADNALGNPINGELNDPVQRKINTLIYGQLKSAGFPLNPNYQSEQEMTPHSDFLNSISSFTNTPAVKYYTIYGDIEMSVTQKLFGMTLNSHKYSFGDLVVLANSASTVSLKQASVKQPFFEKENTVIHSNIIGSVAGFETSYYFPSINNLHYVHTSITQQDDVQRQVIEDLLYEE